MKYPLKAFNDWCIINGWESHIILYEGQEQYIEYVGDDLIWYRDDEVLYTNISKYEKFVKQELKQHTYIRRFYHHMISVERNKKIDDLLGE